MAKAALATLLFLAYPFLIYLGLKTGMGWAAPTFLAIIVIYRSTRHASARGRARTAGAACILAAGAFLAGALTTKLIPVAIHTFLAWFFGHTLRYGPSLVERLVRLQFPEFPPGVTEYCRQVTFAWTLFFVFNIATCLALALLASDFAWLIYNGIVVFVLMALMMIGEYLYRHRRFPNLEIPPPRDTLETIVKNGRRLWNGMREESGGETL